MFAEPLKTQVINFASTGKSLVTLAMCEDDISACGRCSQDICEQKTKIVDADLGILKCEHAMPSELVNAFRFGTPSVLEQFETLVSGDDTDSDTIDGAASGVIESILAAGAVYRREDELGIDDPDGVREAIQRIENSLGAARSTAMLLANEAGVCLTDEDFLTPIAVESEEYILIVVSKCLAEALSMADGDVILPIEKKSLVKVS
jgi:hypothetical protein